jgi:uncharacterized protein
MYTLALALLIGIGGFIAYRGYNKENTALIIAGIGFVLSVIFFFWFMGFWGEKLWFQYLGHERRFWTVIIAKLAAGGAGLLVGTLFMFTLSFLVPKLRSSIRWIAVAASGLYGMTASASSWDVILKFLYRSSTGVNEPVLGKDAGFYLFSLPFFEYLYSLFFMLVVFFLILAALPSLREAGPYLIKGFGLSSNEEEVDRTPPLSAHSRAFVVGGVLLLIVLAAGKLISKYQLLYSEHGVVFGPGWTDVHIKLPAYYLSAAVALIGAVLLLIPAVRSRLSKLAPKGLLSSLPGASGPAAMLLVVVVVIWFLSLNIVPSVFQALRVEPNEISFETEYIRNNIEMTRYGFGLDTLTEKNFPVEGDFSKETVLANPSTISNIRLWDWRALDSVYKQFQEIRLYYEFEGIDIDRYQIGDQYRSVMVSAREMETDNLPADSQTFVNKRYKYTHGYGIAMNTVNEFTKNGLPNFLIQDIPPKSVHPSLEVKRPEIYYGELTDSYVITNSKEQEFDYPSGQENKYIRYEGEGGVPVSNFFRKLLLGWKLDGTSFLFSGYQTAESRVMYYRQIVERAKRAAPFLRFDSDPYITLIDGELRWIMDAYTVSSDFPYSEKYGENVLVKSKWEEEGRRTSAAGSEINYLRNSVKTVINPYNGKVDFYIYDENDVLIQVWEKIFPELFKSRDEMPENIRRHVRYPADYLLIQGSVYAKYHMTDPEVFYNQEDLWVRATEKYYGDTQPVDPYYVMWERPGSDTPQFVVMMPFTPKNRQVLIGWVAGMSDPQNYGEFISYKFPKEKRVLGPQQMETKIDQDSFLSGQLSLWDQRGSSVIRGNVLVIPMDETILYVEPIYLQSDTAAYPELRIVAVMSEDKLSYAPTFEEALKGLYGEAPPPQKRFDGSESAEGEGREEAVSARAASAAGTNAAAADRTIDTLIREANDAFDTYFDLLGERSYGEASQELDRLEGLLRQMAEKSSGSGAGAGEQ